MLFLKQCIVHSKAMLLCLVFCLAAIQPVIGQQWRIGYSSFMGVGLQSDKYVYQDNGGFGNRYMRGKSSSIVGFYGIYQPRQWMWMAQLQFSNIEQRFQSAGSGIPDMNERTRFFLEYPLIQLSLSASYPLAVGRSMQLSPFFGATFQFIDGDIVSNIFSTTTISASYRESNSFTNYGTGLGLTLEPRVGLMFRPDIVHPFWKRINIMGYAQFGSEPLNFASSISTSTYDSRTGQSNHNYISWSPAFTQIMLGVGIDVFQLKKRQSQSKRRDEATY